MNRKLLAGRLMHAAVGLVFIVAGVVKIWDPERFLSALLTYELFSYQFAVLTAAYVPYLEVVAGVCLAAGLWRIGARWLTGAMLLVFILLIVQARFRGLSIDCGCFGENVLSSDGQYLWKLTQNSLWLGLWFLGGFFEREAKSKEA